MLAAIVDSLLVLFFFAIAIFFQILTRAASKSRRRSVDETRRSTPSSQRSRPLTQESDETDEERIRKFLEALGQPTTSKPPPPVAPRIDIPPGRIAALSPPGEMVPTSWPSLKRQLQREIRLPGQIPPTREAKTFRPKVAEAPAFEVHEGPPPLEPIPVIKTAAEAYASAIQSVSKPAQAKIDIVAMLRSTSGLREAIILREIFGPPRSVQPLDLVASV